MIDSKRIVIIVTINIPLGDFLAINIEKVGFKTLIAPDIQSALFLIKTSNPLYIIIDSLLPENGATNLISELEQNSFARQIPIIVLDATSKTKKENKFLHNQSIRQDMEPKEIVTTLMQKITS